jgi:hypothetical protein
VDPLLSRTAIGIAGSAVGAGVAVVVASHLASTRAGSAINPIEAALISLVIGIFKDVGSAISEFLKRQDERRQFVAVLREVQDALGQSTRSGQSIPYSAMTELGNTEAVRAFIVRRNLAPSFASFERELAGVQAYAPTYENVLPKATDDLRAHIETLVRGLTKKG